MMDKSKRFVWFDIGLKTIATLIALFGIWKYFAEQKASLHADAQRRSLGYIERFANYELLQARTQLIEYWQDYPEFAAFIKSNRITERAYSNFVNSTYPKRSDRATIDGALFRLQVFFDEVAFCRSSHVCDKDILDDFFCRYIPGYSQIYGPFFERLAKDIGSAPLDTKLLSLANVCRE